MAIPKNAVAVTPGGAVKDSMIAGYVTMFTVPDDSVSGVKLTRTWASEDLDTDLLPPARRNADVFASACRSVEESGARKQNGQHRILVTVEPVLETPTESVYQVGRRVVDAAERTVEHEKAMRVTFTKGTEDMAFEPLQAEHYAALAGYEDRIREFYAENATQVPGYKVRGVLRTYMGLLGATNLRRKAGGVYFVPARGKATLDSLSTALTALYGERSDLHTIPLINDDGAREMLHKHFTINAGEQVDDLMTKINTALHGARQRSIRKDFLGNVAEERMRITQLRAEYQSLIKNDLTELGSKIEDLDEQMEKLAEATSEEAAA